MVPPHFPPHFSPPIRVVMDKPSGKPKGTAFIEFKNAPDALKAAAACDRGRKGTGPGITFQGRQVDVDMAVNPVCVGGWEGEGTIEDGQGGGRRIPLLGWLIWTRRIGRCAPSVPAGGKGVGAWLKPKPSKLALIRRTTRAPSPRAARAAPAAGGPLPRGATSATCTSQRRGSSPRGARPLTR